MEKVKNEVSGYATLCKKWTKTARMSENFFGAKYKESMVEISILSTEECRRMKETRICGDKPMTCSDKKCSYEEEPEIGFQWLTDKMATTVNCEMHEKFAVAEGRQALGFDLKGCAVDKMGCITKDQTIIWDESCPICQMIKRSYTTVRSTT
jgi:hypothetical protein